MQMIIGALPIRLRQFWLFPISDFHQSRIQVCRYRSIPNHSHTVYSFHDGNGGAGGLGGRRQIAGWEPPWGWSSLEGWTTSTRTRELVPLMGPIVSDQTEANVSRGLADGNGRTAGSTLTTRVVPNLRLPPTQNPGVSLRIYPQSFSYSLFAPRRERGCGEAGWSSPDRWLGTVVGMVQAGPQAQPPRPKNSTPSRNIRRPARRSVRAIAGGGFPFSSIIFQLLTTFSHQQRVAKM